MKCPLCGNPEVNKRLDGYFEPVEGIDYTVLLCPQCKVEFTDPMRNPGKEWYKKSEFYRDSDNPVTGELNPRMKPFFEHEFPEGLKLLDVGCGFGNFLLHAKRKGFNCAGIDFSEKQAETARRNSGVADIEAATLKVFLDKYPGRKFDVITLFGFLEHQEDPSGIMDTCKSMLQDKGYVAINVPNGKRPLWFGNREGWDLPPHHLTRWDPVSLAAFVRRKGFTPVLERETPVTVTHMFNQLIGIRLNKTIQTLVSAMKRLIFKSDTDIDASFEELSAKTSSKNSFNLLNIRLLRRLPLLCIKAAAWLLTLPVTLPSAVYYRAAKNRGCELFILARLS